MIRLTPTASSSRTQEYLHTKRTVTAISRLGLLSSSCCFCFPNCDWDFPAFADLADEGNTYSNDKTDFILKVPDGSTVTATIIELNPDNTTKNTYTVSNTYGQLLPLGTLKANVWGFILDWYKLADAEGFGRYKVNIVVENGSSTEIFNEDSVCFKLEPYSCEAASRTVKIKTEQSGYFEGGFDYTGISWIQVNPDPSSPFLTGIEKTSWPQEIRLYGRFFREGFEYEVDNIVTESRGQQQIQAKTVRRYLMKLDTIPTKLSNRLIEDMLLAPEVYINDYAVSPIELYEDVRVTLTEIADPINFTQNKNEFFEIRFLDWQQDNVHRYK